MIRRHSIYPSGFRFFTLPIDYSMQLHNQIWEMLQFGNGFTWSDLYSMPTRWRTFYFNKLADYKKKENQEYKKAERKSKVKVKK